MKYKELYEAEKYKVNDLRYALKDMTADKEDIEQELRTLRAKTKIIEGRELNFSNEVTWLRDTLSMVIIKPEHMKTIGSAMADRQQEHMDGTAKMPGRRY